MQPDLRASQAREWIERAALDLRAAEFEFTAEPPLTADIVFHCQQVAEKSMKAFLAWHDVPFRKTHNLVELGQQCVAIDPTLDGVMKRGAGLTEYAWRFRYPGEPAEPSASEAREAFLVAGEVYRSILDRLPPEANLQA